jgi:2-dehydro-3-deoxy-L-rhamnonate dehydrogenase (NAD+)
MSRGNLASVQRAASATLARFNATDGPVNKAAIVGPTARVWELAPEDWDRVVQVNLTGVFYCCRAIIQPRLALPSFPATELTLTMRPWP